MVIVALTSKISFLENNQCNNNEPSSTTTPPCPDTTPGPFVEHDNCCNDEIIPVCPSSPEPLTSLSINELSDLDYQPSETSGDSESKEEANLESEMVESKKYVVFESELKKLFSFCQSCASPVNVLSTTTMGSMVVFIYSCINGHSFDWNSQPLINEMPAGNLIISSPILFSGNTFSSINSIASFSDIPITSKTKFYDIQKQYLWPTADRTWKNTCQKQIISELSNSERIDLCGDGRADSPGHNAKYGT